MARKKKPEEAKGGLPEYMGTYGDMVTLILCFFVLLYSMSSIDIAKFQAVAASFSSNTSSLMQSGGASGLSTLLGNGILEMPSVQKSVKQSEASEAQKKVEAQQELQKMASDFKTYFAQHNLVNNITVDVSDQYVRLRFGDILFDVGKDTLRTDALPVLDKVIEEVARYSESDIKIEGHTDNDPINTIQFRSNWYLSAARAISVAYYFIDNGGISADRISTEGFGEFKPIAPNDSPENKAKNRRVEVKIYSQYYSTNTTQ